jgi:hypothetical protein
MNNSAAHNQPVQFILMVGLQVGDGANILLHTFCI